MNRPQIVFKEGYAYDLTEYKKLTRTKKIWRLKKKKEPNLNNIFNQRRRREQGEKYMDKKKNIKKIKRRLRLKLKKTIRKLYRKNKKEIIKRKVFLKRPGTIRNTPVTSHRKIYRIPRWALRRRRVRKFIRIISVPQVRKTFKMVRNRLVSVRQFFTVQERKFYKPKSLIFTVVKLPLRRIIIGGKRCIELITIIKKKTKNHKKLGNKYNFYGERLKKANLIKLIKVIKDYNNAKLKKLHWRQQKCLRTFLRRMV